MASADNINAGGAVVTIGGDASPLESVLKKVQGKIQDFGETLGSIGEGLAISGAVIGAAGAAISAPFLHGLSVLEQWGDETQRLMRQTGLSFSETSTLVNGLRGNLLEPISSAQISAGLATMNKFLDNARSGGVEATRALNEMGLSFSELQSMSASDRFNAIADGLQRVGDSGRRSAIAMEIFGRRNVFAMNLQGGSAGIRERAQEVRGLQGDALGSSASLNAANEVRLEFNRMKLATEGFWATLGLAAAPVMRNFYNLMTRLIVGVRSFAENNRTLLTVIFWVADKLVLIGSVMATVGGAFVVVGKALAMFSSWWAVIAGVMSPIIAAFSAAATPILIIGAALLAAYLAIRAFGLTVMDVWEAVVNWVSSIIDAVDWIDVLTYAVIYFGGMLLISLTPAIIVIGLIALQLYLLYEAFMFIYNVIAENWPAISGFFADLWNRITIVVNAVFDVFRSIGDAIYPFVSGIIEFLGGIVDGFIEMFNELRSIVSNGVDTISAIVGDIGAAFGGIRDMISAGDWAGAFEIAMLAIQIIWERTKNYLIDSWYRVVFLFGSAWDDLVRGLRMPLATMLAGIVSLFYSFLRSLELGINMVITGINATIASLPARFRPAMLETVNIAGGEGAAVAAIVRNVGGLGNQNERVQDHADRTRLNELQAQQDALAERARFDAEAQAIWDAMEVGTGQRRGGGGGLEFSAGIGSFSAAALGQVGASNYAERTANAVEALLPRVDRVGDLIEADEGGVVQ